MSEEFALFLITVGVLAIWCKWEAHKTNLALKEFYDEEGT